MRTPADELRASIPHRKILLASRQRYEDTDPPAALTEIQYRNQVNRERWQRKYSRGEPLWVVK